MEIDQKKIIVALFLILLFFVFMSLYIFEGFTKKAFQCVTSPVNYLFDTFGKNKNMSCYCMSINDDVKISNFDLPEIIENDTTRLIK